MKIRIEALLIVFFVTLVLLSTPVLGWYNQTHLYLCEKILEKLPEFDQESFLRGCIWPDEIGGWQNHFCMQECRAATRADQHLDLVRNFLFEGDFASASFHAGAAAHYILDASCPYHTTFRRDEHRWFESVLQNIAFDVRVEKTDLTIKQLAVLANAELPELHSAYLANSTVIAEKIAKPIVDDAIDIVFTKITDISATELPYDNCSDIMAILSDKDACHLMTVRLSGIVMNLNFKISRAGNEYTVFDLLDDNEKIKVFVHWWPKIKEGDSVLVQGPFYRERTVSGYTFYDEVEALDVRLMSRAMESEEQKNISPILVIAALILLFYLIIKVPRWLSGRAAVS